MICWLLSFFSTEWALGLLWLGVPLMGITLTQ